jgi:hypothetical protein
MKKLFFLGLLIGSFAIPYLLSQGGGTPLASLWNKTSASADGEEADDAPSLKWPVAEVAGVAESAAPIDRDVEWAPTVPFDRALSFNATIPWVLGTWPQVSTGIVDKDLFGYRVPLVTGTAEDDVTGSLTYYFGGDKTLRRIVLEGDTGDARRLVALLSARYQVLRHLTDEQGVFYYRSSQDSLIQTELKVRPRGIVQAAVPHQRFVVSLQMSRVPAER